MMLFEQPGGSQSDTAMVASHVNYANDDHHKCSERVQLPRFVA